METNYDMLSTDELNAKKDKIESEYNEGKFIVTDYMKRLIELKDEYDAIEDIIRKRNGQNAG